MKRILLCLTVLLLTGCAHVQTELPPQEVEQLHPYDLLGPPLPQDQTAAVKAVWVPFMLIDEWMDGHSETEFRAQVREAFTQCAQLGLNTVYLHVRAYADAYYRSGLFPSYTAQGYDPLAIMTEEARAQGLSPHAWINPLRAGTAQQLAETESAYPLRRWYGDAEKNGTYLVETDGRFYLNPAYPEVRRLVADGAVEIVRAYDVDGIHIDDYFYPTTDPGFDAEAFAQSGSGDLAQWRRDNCSALVRELYAAVKAEDPALCFSISPQGNPAVNRDKLYADTLLWCSEPGYCDCMIPQLYYGFANETCPFAETLAVWEEACTAAELVIGLAAYKVGQEDIWAGSGSTEWITDGTVLSRETAIALNETDGIALYSCSYLFAPENAEEMQRLRQMMTA